MASPASPVSRLRRYGAVAGLVLGVSLGFACTPSAPQGAKAVEPSQPEPSVPEGPLLVSREIRAGATYKIHVLHAFPSGSNMIADATARVVSAGGPDGVPLDVHLIDVSAPGVRQLYGDLRLQASVPTDKMAAEEHRWLRHADPEIVDGVNATFHSFSMYACVVPQRAHVPGEKWTESMKINGDELSIEWKVGPREVVSGAVWANYDATIHALFPNGASSVFYEVSLRVRVDDGFIGDCTVHYLVLGPQERTITRITSTRVE
ncbi:hypothetical protein [Nannocystis sp. SCPEA4]|uniref:hypothetical protein n=1 Tax=Nannocystis sp. SCPEA4 TaxID=2996787 RepID=UPI0022722088|nr:hypothetical protein [Nannocystis sp. SCPEA4]MCY1056714.1 hypothetical protein [Nannocystis sp. SCPEA4]